MRMASGNALLSAGLLYCVCAGYVIITYVLIIIMLDGETRPGQALAWWVNPIAIVIITLTFAPVRRWLQLGIDHLIYSQDNNPYAVVSQINQQLDTVAETDALLPTLVTTIATTLQLPYVAIETQLAGIQPAAYGLPPPQPRSR